MDANTSSSERSGAAADHVEHVSFWKPAGVRSYLATSGLNFVGVLQDGRTVLKYPHRSSPESLACLREEAERYVRLGPHPNLVAYRGFTGDGLLLEFCERGDLGSLIQNPTVVLNDGQRSRISEQVVECLAFLHGRNYIHCDIHVRNIFLTSDLVAKVGDLQGQLYGEDGSVEMETMAQEDAKSRHPLAGEDEFTTRTDIFALGTLLYHLWHEHPPFPELDIFKDHDLIEARFRRKHYPADLSPNLRIDDIIRKCWDSWYGSADEVLHGLCRIVVEVKEGESMPAV